MAVPFPDGFFGFETDTFRIRCRHDPASFPLWGRRMGPARITRNRMEVLRMKYISIHTRHRRRFSVRRPTAMAAAVPLPPARRLLLGIFCWSAMAMGIALALVLATGRIVRGEEQAAPSLVSGILVEDFDPEVPPQEDFYLHVNGKWLERTEIPSDQSNYGIFTVLQEESQAALRRLVEQLADRDDHEPGSEEQKIGDFYRSFMNTDRLEALGLDPIRKELLQLQQIDSRDALIEWMAANDRQGIGNPLALFVSPDARQSDRYAVYLTQYGTSLPDRDYYLVDEQRYLEIRQAFVRYVADLLEAAEFSDTDSIAQRILDLETKLAEVQWSRVENRDPLKTYNKMSGEEIEQLLPDFDWSSFAELAEVGEQPAVIVRQPSYLEGFNRIYREVPLEVWKEYYAYRLVNHHAASLSSKFDDLHFDFYSRTLSGVDEPKPRWKRGLDALDGSMGEMVGKLYVRDNFAPEAKERMEVLVVNLKRAFDKRIRQLDWMSEATKREALAKLTKVRTKIGYPDKWKDYSRLEIEPDQLVENLRRVAEFEHQRAMEKLAGPVDRDEWHMNPQTVNAYYNPLGNEIVFPAAILQPPFFNLEADDAVNYGAIGAVIGHELSHAFDDKGSRYDGDGNLRNWWTAEDRKAFDERGEKLVEQFSSYNPIGEMKLNGELTLGENIGDLGGLNMAHTAYRLSLDGQEAPVMDGLTGDQRFFIGWSQIWRRKYRDEELRRRLLTDPHSPSRYRVIGIVSNMDAFYDAFPAEAGDAMYIPPENRVRIW
jgi:putative endopeptidase